MNKKPQRGVITEQGDLGLGMNVLKKKDQDVIDKNQQTQRRTRPENSYFGMGKK